MVTFSMFKLLIKECLFSGLTCSNKGNICKAYT